MLMGTKAHSVASKERWKNISKTERIAKMKKVWGSRWSKKTKTERSEYARKIAIIRWNKYKQNKEDVKSKII